MDIPKYISDQPSFKPLLPNEPRVQDWEIQQELTERFLTHATASLEALFLQLRSTLDPVLAQAQPIKLGKLYPLGQCLEISLAMKDLLNTLDPSALVGTPAQGYSALADFLRHGGNMRRVWGDLRGEYFQNAFLAGTLYIDVSNDTVTRTKPPVEILPFVNARFRPVEDYGHFAQLASRYWKAHIFPNHIIPSIAPYFPLISLAPGGSVRLQAFSDYMVSVVETGEFRPSETVLDAPPMGSDLFQLMKYCLAGASFEIASDPLQGRASALQACETFRAGRYQHDTARRTTVVEHLREANKRLTCLQVQAGAP